MTGRTALIVGGGIGGLSAAVALHRRGWSVHVLERAPDGSVYCYGAASVPAGAAAPDSELAELRRRFGRWHAPIPALLAASDEQAVLRHDLYDLPPLPSFVSGTVALLGDAAHAMTPNLGQGACQALEDAVTLAAVLGGRTPGADSSGSGSGQSGTGGETGGETGDDIGDIAAALARYDRGRRPRTQRIVRRSRQIGAFLQADSAPVAWLRNTSLRLTPDAVTRRTIAAVIGWTPPTDATAWIRARR